MKTLNARSASLLAIAVGLILLTGCDGATAVAGPRPEDRLNPSMSPQQRAVTLRHRQERGDIPAK